MKFNADINVMPLKALLDPQGKAVTASMHNIGFKTVENVRIGKRITLQIEAENLQVAEAKIEEACKKILSNQVMEFYEYSVTKIEE
jgi:phosphoribosylformylglycinamidine synthase